MNKRIRILLQRFGISITPKIENIIKQFGNLPISNKELLKRIDLLKNTNLFSNDDESGCILYNSYEFAMMYPHLEKKFIRIWILIHKIEYITGPDYTHIYSVYPSNDLEYYIVIRIRSINDLSSRISIEIRDFDCTHCPGPSIKYKLK